MLFPGSIILANRGVLLTLTVDYTCQVAACSLPDDKEEDLLGDFFRHNEIGAGGFIVWMHHDIT